MPPPAQCQSWKHAPLPLPANTADATKAALEILFVSIISRAILKQISSAAPLFRNLRWPIPWGSDFSMHVKNDHQSILKLCKIWCFRETVNDFLTYRQICGQRLIEIASCFVYRRMYTVARGYCLYESVTRQFIACLP